VPKALRWIAAGVAVALVAFVGVACGDDDDNAADTAGAANGDTKVAMLLFSRGFEFMVALDQGAQEQARSLGIDMVVLDGQGDSATQISQIEDQIAAGVDGFIISPNNSEEIVPGIEAANNAGIPVVTVDAIAAGGDVAGHVGFDNEAAGAVAAEEMARLIGDEGDVLELTGAQGAYHAVRRGGGFNEAMSSDHPDINVVTRDSEWNADNALNLTVDNFTANQDIKGIFTHNDEMVRGVVSGLSQVGQGALVGEDGHVAVIGIDGTPLALERIRNGEQDATVQQDPFEMGALAVSAIDRAMKGESVEPEQLLEPLLVTRDNVDDEELWGNRFEG
jgi:ribose transport system substrate-binding protein